MIGLIISTVYLKAQVLENKFCLNTEEINYFINQDLTAKSLIKDTTLLKNEIKRSDSINKLQSENILDLKKNENDLKLSLKNEKLVSYSYKKSYEDKCIKYDKKVKFNKILKKTLLGSTLIILAESTIIYLTFKK